MVKIGIIGGSGLDNPDILQDAIEKDVMTPYGKPSSSLRVGTINGVTCVLLARHGRDHSIMPTNVNNRANIWALKDEGCTHILASTACGSLRDEIKPGHLVMLDQFIDRTTQRVQTFYDRNTVCHIPMAEPFCPHLRHALSLCAADLGLWSHSQGTVVTIEGPRFSSKGESRLFRSWGADVINMSTVPEVVLAREAGICYCVVAMATDYDSWHEAIGSVSWEEVLRVFQANAKNVIALFSRAVKVIVDKKCHCQSDVTSAIVGKSKKEFDLKSLVRTIPDFPKQGILFRDITTLLLDPQALSECCTLFYERFKGKKITKIVAIESRGFVFGAALAQKMGVGLVLARKKGKLPGKTNRVVYALEYGSDCVEIHEDAIALGERVLVVDDLIATGGTALAVCQLVEQMKGVVCGCAFVIDLPELGGMRKLLKYQPYALVEFEGE